MFFMFLLFAALSSASLYSLSMTMHLLHTIKTRSKHRESRLTDNMQTAKVATLGPLLSKLCRESLRNMFRINVCTSGPCGEYMQTFPERAICGESGSSQGRVH